MEDELEVQSGSEGMDNPAKRSKLDSLLIATAALSDSLMSSDFTNVPCTSSTDNDAAKGSPSESVEGLTNAEKDPKNEMEDDSEENKAKDSSDQNGIKDFEEAGPSNGSNGSRETKKGTKGNKISRRPRPSNRNKALKGLKWTKKESEDNAKSYMSVEDSGYAENLKKYEEEENASNKDENMSEEADKKNSNDAETSSNSNLSNANGGVENKSEDTDENASSSSSRLRTPTSRSTWRSRFGHRNYRSQVLSTSSSDDENEIQRIIRDAENEIFSEDDSSSEDEGENPLTDAYERPSSDSSSSDMNYSLDSDGSNTSTNEYAATVVKDLSSKTKPGYSFNLLQGLRCREQGLSDRGRRTLRSCEQSFQEKTYAARQTVERMTIVEMLEGHGGCVNSLNFNKAGDLLVSGSDDLKIKLWNWASNKVVHSFTSGHNLNVFQTKFLELGNGINIVSSARDGQVRHMTIPSSGGQPISTVLIKHLGSVHKIALTPNNPYEIITAGEDGHVVRCDLRDNRKERVVTVKVKKRNVPLYSIAHHPFDQEFCVCGRDQFIRVYDKRNLRKVQAMMCPSHLEDKKPFASHITCAVYNWNGSEILASYSDEDIYLFNNKCYLPGHFTHKYKGHNNNNTIKGVNFFGLNSEYVVSGSDCGNIFFWEKNSESIINWVKGDFSGVVNCLEPHPSFPVMATSGLDKDVKIWMPISETYPPKMAGLERCVKGNTKRPIIAENDWLIDDTTFFFFVRQCLRNRRTNDVDGNCPNVQDLLSSDSGEEYDYEPRGEPFQERCSPQ